MDIKLILPTSKYKQKIEQYKKGLIEAGSGMDGCGSLRNDNVDIWLNKCKDWRVSKNLPAGYVASTQYICVRKSDDKLIGMLQIRHELSDFLFNYGGHIGDSVAVDERRKGYGKQLLALGLKKCKLLGLNKILVTCKDTNIASRKCILFCGGKYEDTRHFDADNVNLERYWIKIK